MNGTETWDPEFALRYARRVNYSDGEAEVSARQFEWEIFFGIFLLAQCSITVRSIICYNFLIHHARVSVFKI